MLRRLLPAVLLALALLGAASAPAAPSSGPTRAERGVTRRFHVYARRPGEKAWKRVGSFTRPEPAAELTRAKVREGFDVEVRSITTILHSKSKTGPQPAPATGEAIAYDQAAAAFGKLRACRDIAFGFPYDGCYARAHIMCQLMLRMGLKPAKAWAFGQLHAASPVPKSGFVHWGYHVAPALLVRQRTGAGRFVIDPSLFDRPVPLTQWVRRMWQQGTPMPRSQVTALGRPPVVDGKAEGTGYVPGALPAELVDAHAEATMMVYKRLEGIKVAPTAEQSKELSRRIKGLAVALVRGQYTGTRPAFRVPGGLAWVRPDTALASRGVATRGGLDEKKLLQAMNAIPLASDLRHLPRR
jgi:hypothetical protein